MNRSLELTQRSSYSAMGMGRHDFEACYKFSEAWDLYGLHCHDFFEFYVYFRGAKFYCIDNQVFPLEQYQLIIVPPFHMHGLVGESLYRDYERCFLYASPTMLKSCGAGLIDLEQFFVNHVRGGRYQFRMTEEEGELCKKLMQDLHNTQMDTSSLGNFSNHTKMLQFLDVICQVLHRAQETVEPIVVNEAMQEILSYVNDHFTSPIKLETLARQFGVSVSFLSHEFVKYTGRSVYDYVLYRRVLLSKEMINSGIPLNEVAFQCGFNDYSSFLRAFTKIAGASPSAYRKASHTHR